MRSFDEIRKGFERRIPYEVENQISKLRKEVESLYQDSKDEEYEDVVKSINQIAEVARESFGRDDDKFFSSYLTAMETDLRNIERTRNPKFKNSTHLIYYVNSLHDAEAEDEVDYIEECVPFETDKGVFMYERKGLVSDDLENINKEYVKDYQGWEKNYFFLEDDKFTSILVRGNVLKPEKVNILVRDGKYALDFIKESNDIGINSFTSLIYQTNMKSKDDSFYVHRQIFNEHAYEEIKIKGFRHCNQRLTLNNIAVDGEQKHRVKITNNNTKLTARDLQELREFNFDTKAMQYYLDKIKYIEELLKINSKEIEFEREKNLKINKILSKTDDIEQIFRETRMEEIK